MITSRRIKVDIGVAQCCSVSMDQLNIFVQQTICVVKDNDVIIKSEENDCYCCCPILQLNRWMRIAARSYYLLSEKKQQMFFTHAGRSSLLSLLLFSNHNHPFFFSSLLLFHTLLLYTHVHLAYTHMSRRRQRRRRRDFPPLSIHTSRGKRGRERKRIGGRR